MSKDGQHETGNSSDAKTSRNTELAEAELANVSGGYFWDSTRIIEGSAAAARFRMERTAYGIARRDGDK